MCVWSWIPECVQNEMRENIEEIKIKQQSQIDAWWQKADESWREQKDCGNDEEHSRSLELQLGFPLRAVFLQILPSASFSYVLHVALYTDMYTQSSLPFKSNTCSILPTLCLWLCVCVCVFLCEKILRLAGGLERLKLEGLSNPVAMEIQDIIKSHIEKKWLPMFLSTTEFIERQKHRPKVGKILTT